MSIWQTESWQKMLVWSKQTEKFFVQNDVYIEKRRISLWKYGLFVIGYEGEVLDDIKEYLVELCKKEECLFVQVEVLAYDWKISNIWEKFKEWCYKKFITPYTAVIDLGKSQDEILAEMKSKWRYNIRLAEKKWLEVKKVEKTDENVRKFYELISETTTRNSFSGNTFSYYKEFLKGIDNSELLLAYSWDIVIAGGIFIFDKEVSIYYYWASTSNTEYRKFMAPYLLQWEAIKIAKKLWSKLYDFLWVATPWEKDSSLLWVTDFKWKLTPDIREVSMSYIWINKKLLYNFVVLLRTLKNMLK